MDVVIPLGKGSLHQDLELRYCLRSIEQYVNDVENVFIVGQKPAFLKNVIHIAASDNDSREQKEANIFRKIDMACRDKRVSDEFLFFNDDHFLLDPFAPDTYHYKCSLQESLLTRKVNDNYAKTLANTLGIIRMGNNFDTHCPIVYKKDWFLRSVSTAPWYQKNGFCIKSLYCNMNGIEGEYYPDLKINKQHSVGELFSMLIDRPYFSVADQGFTNDFRILLQMLYPCKSIYES